MKKGASSIQVPDDAPGQRHSQVFARLKLLAKRIQTGPFGSLLHASDYVSGEIPVINPSNLLDEGITPDLRCTVTAATKARLREYVLRQGDVIISRRGELGRCAVVREEEAGWICGTGCLVVCPDQSLIEPTFLATSLRGTEAVAWLLQNSIGTTMDNLNEAILGRLIIRVPDLEVQRRSVGFLQNCGERIDQFVANKRLLIRLFEEQKRTIINNAVTRGVSANAPLKRSGLDWLGDIPAHWDVRRNVSLFQERIEKGRDDLPVLIVSLHTGVTVSDAADEVERPRRLIENKAAYKLAVEGDIAYNMMRMWQGAVGVVPKTGLVSPAYVVARPLSGVNTGYYSLLFRTEMYKNEINRNSRGIVTDRNRLYWDDFKQLGSPVPPPTEQLEIVEVVSADTARIQAAIETAQREIELIREFRTTLISDVVAGRLNAQFVHGLEASLI